MRPVLRPVVLLATVLLTAAPAAQAARGPVTANVVGGTNAVLTDVPWQALVYPGRYLCGGSILDATHVVTAAHCVYDKEPTPVSSIEVYAGVTAQASLGAGQAGTVVAAIVDPEYDPNTHTHDAAILTLAPPGFDLARADIEAIPLTDVGFVPGAGVDMTTSGWGTMLMRAPNSGVNTDPVADYLQIATHLHADAGCTGYADYNPVLHLCAGGSGQGNCQGDSGGPLTIPVGGTPKLAGIVSAAAGCAYPGIPALYTRVADPGIHAFLAARGVGYGGAAPFAKVAPSIYGTATLGSNVGCDRGTWTGAYDYTYRWARGDGTTLGSSLTLLLKPADLGQTVRCVVTGTGVNGSTIAESAPITIAADGGTAYLPPADPGPQPITPPKTLPERADTTPPTARVRSTRCANRACVIDVAVADPMPSSGVAGLDVRASTTQRTTCKKGAKRRPCTKTVTRTLAATATGPGAFLVKTPKLKAGSYTFSITARDKAGNRQKIALAVKKRLR
jgi:trypsin